MDVLPVEIIDKVVGYCDVPTLVTLYCHGDIRIQELVKRNSKRVQLLHILLMFKEGEVDIKKFLTDIMPQFIQQSIHTEEDIRCSFFVMLETPDLLALTKSYCAMLHWNPFTQADTLTHLVYMACARGKVHILDWLKEEHWCTETKDLIMEKSSCAVGFGQVPVLQWINDNYNMQGHLSKLTIWFQVAAQEFQLPVLKWHRQTYDWWHKDYTTELQLKRLFFNVHYSRKWYACIHSPVHIFEWLVDTYPDFKSLINWSILWSQTLFKCDHKMKNWIHKEAPLTFRAQLLATNTVNWLQS